MKLETFEWINSWWEHTESKEGRVLLVGDSICNGYNANVRKELAPIPVDHFASSLAIDNPALLHEMKMLLEMMANHYSVIHFNNGLHGWHLSTEEYKAEYEKVLCYLLKHANGAKVVLALSTPTTVEKNPDLNARVLERNAAVLELAEKYGLAVDDLYSAVDGNLGIRLADGYHYTAEGYVLLGKTVSDFLRKNF